VRGGLPIAGVVLALMLATGAAPAAAGSAPTAQYIVGFRASVPVSARAAIARSSSPQARVKASLLGSIRAEVVTTDAAGARALRSDPRVRYVQKNATQHIDSLPNSPNDPMFGNLWALSNTGQTVNGVKGTAGDDIGAKQAWSFGTGSRSVVVADVDSGMDVTHPDLAANLWINPGENCTGCRTDGVDNDGNGFVDDWHGWDFVGNDNVTDDQSDHGTHTAGTIGAAGDNGVGVIGVDPVVSLMPVKFIDSTGNGSDSNAAAAIIYAANNGARVINASFSGDYSQAISDAIAYASSKGVLYVASAGNDGNANALYPAATDQPNVISVAATDQNDKMPSWSSFGNDTVDLAAPGVNILSTWPGGGYQYLDGTSMAAPQVSGAAALLISQHPNATAATIKALLLSTVTPVSTLTSKVISGGRLNVGAAAACGGKPDVWIDSPRPGFVAAAGRPVQVRVLAGECAAPAGVTVTATIGKTPVTLTGDGNGLYTGTFTPFATGGTTFTAQATDGTTTATRTYTGKVAPDLSMHGIARTITVAANSDALASFTEQAGHTLTLQLGAASFGAMTVTIIGPDGAKLQLPTSVAAGGGTIHPQATWLNGEYTVRVHPVNKGAGSVAISVNDPSAPPDQGAPIATDGTPTSVSLPTAGMTASYTFSGTAGGRVSMRISNDTISSSTIQILRPDGKNLAQQTNVTTAGVYFNAKPLPLTGTYTLVIDPNGSATGSLTAQVWNLPPDVTGPLTVNGAGLPITLGSPGQNAALTFTGTAGAGVTVRLTSDSIQSLNVSILKPDSTTLAGPKFIGVAGGTLAATLPASGTYTVVVDPVTFKTGSVTVAVTSP
jgi:subtilisin family serine protease